MAYHVDEAPSAAMLGKGVLMLAFRYAHVMLNVEISEKLLKSVTGAFACAVGVEDAKALRALSFC